MPTVMDPDRVSRSLARIAHEILERHATPHLADQRAFVGIRTRGAPIARRLRDEHPRARGVPTARRRAATIAGLGALEIPTGALDITLYRDDFMRHAVGPQPLVR